VSGLGVSDVQTHSELVCPHPAAPVITDGPSGWSWMEFPAHDELDVQVKPDGTIQGSYTRTGTSRVVTRLHHEDLT